MKISTNKTKIFLASIGLFIAPLALAQSTEVAFPTPQQGNANSSAMPVTMPWASLLSVNYSLTKDPFYLSLGVASIPPSQLGPDIGNPFILAFDQETAADAAINTMTSSFTTTQTTMTVGASFKPSQHPADLASSLFSLGAPSPALGFVASSLDMKHPVTAANFKGLPTNANFMIAFHFSNVVIDPSAMAYVNQHATSLSVQGAPIPGGSLAHAGLMLSFSADGMAMSELTEEDYQNLANHVYAYKIPAANAAHILKYLPPNAARLFNVPDMKAQDARTFLGKYPHLAFTLRSAHNNRPFFIWRDPNSTFHQAWSALPNGMIMNNGIVFHQHYAAINANALVNAYDVIRAAVPGTQKALTATLFKGASMFAASPLPDKMLIVRDQNSADFAESMMRNIPNIKGNLSFFMSGRTPFDGTAFFHLFASKLSSSSTCKLMTPAGINMGELQGKYKQSFPKGVISNYTLPQSWLRKSQITNPDIKL